MCNPMAIAAGVAMVAGTYAQHRGQVKAEEAQINVRRAEDSRQKIYKEQAEAGLSKNMDATSADTITSKINTNTATRDAAYKAQGMAAPHAAEQASSSSLGGNSVVSDNLKQALGAAQQRTDGIGNARAQLGAFGDTMFDTNILTGRGRQDIGQAADSARHSLQPVDAELGAAGHKGDKLKNLGTLLQIAGSVMSAGAGTAAAGGGAAAASGSTAAAGSGTAAATGAMGSSMTSWLSPLLASGASMYAGGGQSSNPYNLYNRRTDVAPY